MKQQHIFPGVILIGLGIYYLSQQSVIPLSFPVSGWPAIVFLSGIAFFLQAYGGKNTELILPAVILLGIGAHLYLAEKWDHLLDYTGIFILLIALGYFLTYKITNSGKFFFGTFLLLAVIQLFYPQIFQWLGIPEEKMLQFEKFWPFILIAAGSYVFLFKRK